MSKRLTLFNLLTIAALVLAACAVPATEAPKLACTDKIGCVEVGAKDPIHIAWMFVVSGEDASLGVDERRGVEIAVDDKKQILGHDIKLDGVDSLCNAEGGQAAGAKLSADKTIVAVIGSSCSSEIRAGGPAMSQAGFTMISPSNTAPDLTDPAKRLPGYFRTAHNDNFQGKVAAEFAFNGLKVKTAATIHDGSLYAQQLQQVFADEFKKLGGTITSQEAIQPTDKDMKPVLTKIATGKPEFIYLPVFVAAGGFLTSQAKQVAGLEKTGLMGADGMFALDFLKAADKASTGMYLSSPDFAAFAAGYKDFLDKHQKKYNEKPLSAFHAHGYDAAGIIFAAIEKVAKKNADGSLLIGRQDLRDAVQATKDYKGVTGTLACLPNGDCGAPLIAVYQVEKVGKDMGDSTKKVWPK